MLQEGALARRFDVIVVTDLTRLSRSQGDLSKMIDRLTAEAIRVVGVQDGYDSARRGHKLQAGLSGIIRKRGLRWDGCLRSAFKCSIGAILHHLAECRSRRGVHGARNLRQVADGMSPRSIAAELNARHIPSPGASWKRRQRRADGWMGSGIRVIVQSERYSGVIHWNTSERRKDPDTGKRRRIMRPRSEWVSHIDESLRIVPDDLWERACAAASAPGARLRANPVGRKAEVALVRLARVRCLRRPLHDCRQV